MEWFSKLFNKEDSSAPPEQLVFGAELKCPCGFKHSFLIVQTDNIDIDNLPLACVRDSKAFVNIMPFGTCTLGLECEQMIELEDLWENLEPQSMMVGEYEAITTKSVLLCKKSGMWIEPVTSGQDGKAARRIVDEAALVREMKQKYPGLLEILEDPYGSLYLHEGMCEMAVRFLEDSLRRNGDMEMASLYGEYDMEGQLIRSALGHLLVTCDVSRLELLVEGLSARGIINGMEDTPGWDARILNEEMLEMVRREYPETAERIETKSYYKWQEEHKKALSVLGQMATEIAYGCMTYECMIATKPYTGAVENKKSFIKGEETANENGKTEGGLGGSENGTDANTFKAPEIKANAKGELTNGEYTLNEADMQVHVDGRNPRKSQFLHEVDASKAVLDAAAYADLNDLWEAGSGNSVDFANKAKVYVENGPVGVTGNGQLTSYINVYRTKTGYVHGCPGNP